MTDSQAKKVKINVICKGCKHEPLSVTIPLPTDQCCDDCEWQVEHNLPIECYSSSVSDVTTPLFSLPAKHDTPVDKGALENSVGIIIVGRPGAGKTTVVKKGLFPDCSEFHKEVGSIEDPQIEILSCNSEGVEYKIVMISSNANYNKKDPEAGCRKLYALKDKFPCNISLILFVYRQGRFTDEEKEIFYFGKQCFQSASALCATVVTNCDGMTSEAKEKIVDDFKENSNTKELAEFMKKMPGICCVSFPDLDSLDPKLQEVYKQEFSASHIALSKLLLDEDKMGIDKVFKEPQQKSGGRFASGINISIPWRSQP